jgi:hypothetical protein
VARVTLNLGELDRLRISIAGDEGDGGIVAGFDENTFALFVRVKCQKNFMQMTAAAAFPRRVGEFLDNMNTNGAIGLLLDSLIIYWASEKANRPDLVDIVTELKQLLESVVSPLSPSVDREHGNVADPQVLTIVISSAGTDEQWKAYFKKQLNLAMEPCRIIDTAERTKQSKDAFYRLDREIENADLFVALVSKTYTRAAQTANELNHARKVIQTETSRFRRVLALALDQDGVQWLKGNYDCLSKDERNPFFRRDFLDKEGRRLSIPNGASNSDLALQVKKLGTDLRKVFETRQTIGRDVVTEDLPHPAGKIVILGESRGDAPPVATNAIRDLISNLEEGEAPFEQVPDRWRNPSPLDLDKELLANRPVFVRTIVDKITTIAKESERLSAELKASFGFQFDDDGEQTLPLQECPRVLWRPGGPQWTTEEPEKSSSPNVDDDARPGKKNPAVHVSIERPPEFAKYLMGLVGREYDPPDTAIVHYEVPIEAQRSSTRGDSTESLDNLMRLREVLENGLIDAISCEIPPVHPDSAPFGPEQLPEVISLIGGTALRVIAAHDLRTRKGAKEATLDRFREIDRSIDQTLARSKTQTPLLRVAVLHRNADIFPQLQFGSRSRVGSWQILRILKRNGDYIVDQATLDNLRQCAALLRGNIERPQ